METKTKSKNQKIIYTTVGLTLILLVAITTTSTTLLYQFAKAQEYSQRYLDQAKNVPILSKQPINHKGKAKILADIEMQNVIVGVDGKFGMVKVVATVKNQTLSRTINTDNIFSIMKGDGGVTDDARDDDNNGDEDKLLVLFNFKNAINVKAGNPFSVCATFINTGQSDCTIGTFGKNLNRPQSVELFD